MLSIEQWYSRRLTATKTQTVKRALQSPFTDCTTGTVIQLGGLCANVWLRCIRTIRLSRLSARSVKANCPLQFAPIASFFYFFVCPPSIYSWYILATVDLEISSCLIISEIERSMRRAPMICPRPKAFKLGSLPILAIPTANSEQPQHLLYIYSYQIK
ncbi:hypothetical protein TNCV_3199461 [Trichonephila clavipes]|nr:hypothetical protein TNCV_3199461 [Trichonephila clavipes]